MYNWEFCFTKDIFTDEIQVISNNILDVFSDGMGGDLWNIKKIKEKIKPSNERILGLLKDKNNVIGGYLLALVPEKRFCKKQILWIDSTSIRKRLQNQNFYRTGLEKLINWLSKEQGLLFIGGRSQNPSIFYIKDSLSNGKIYPFDKTYSAEISSFLINNIPEVNGPYLKGKLAANDLRYGICRAIYSGKLGDYDENFRKGRVSLFEEKLTQWKFNRLNGDAIIVLKEIV